MKRRRLTHRSRIVREFYGTAAVIPPGQPGALAQCAFCEWGRFFRSNQRKRYSALARAMASLRDHAKREHADKFPKMSTAAEIFGDGIGIAGAQSIERVARLLDAKGDHAAARELRMTIPPKAGEVK